MLIENIYGTYIFIHILYIKKIHQLSNAFHRHHSHVCPTHCLAVEYRFQLLEANNNLPNKSLRIVLQPIMVTYTTTIIIITATKGYSINNNSTPLMIAKAKFPIV